jgi:membrane-bound inhibitor of C-type lysozyme
MKSAIPFPWLLAVAAFSGCSQPAPDARTMTCADGPIVTFRHPDPEHLELTLDGSTHVLERQRTASGARYTGDGIDFWNKGAEVMLTLGGQRFTCSID